MTATQTDTFTDTDILALFGDDLEPLMEGQRLQTLSDLTNYEARQAELRADLAANAPPMIVKLDGASIPCNTPAARSQNAKSYCPDYERLEPAGAGIVIDGYIKHWPKLHNVGQPFAALNVIPGDGFTYIPNTFMLTGPYAVHTWPSGDRCIVALADGERISFYDAVERRIAALC